MVIKGYQQYSQCQMFALPEVIQHCKYGKGCSHKSFKGY